MGADISCQYFKELLGNLKICNEHNFNTYEIIPGLNGIEFICADCGKRAQIIGNAVMQMAESGKLNIIL